MELMELAKDFGPLVGIVLFFIWRDWRREEGLVERVKNLEEFNTEVLTEMVKNNATVIATNTAVIATNTEQLRLMNERLNG
ncbi:MAG: hypothetical protein ACYSW8_26900 [Planctomycetota bacterium]|jgi:hypothetical protein